MMDQVSANLNSSGFDDMIGSDREDGASVDGARGDQPRLCFIFGSRSGRRRSFGHADTIKHSRTNAAIASFPPAIFSTVFPSSSGFLPDPSTACPSAIAADRIAPLNSGRTILSHADGWNRASKLSCRIPAGALV